MRGGMGSRLSSGTEEKFRLRNLNKQAFPLLVETLKPQLRLLVAAMALTLVISGANALLPLIIKVAVDKHVMAGRFNGLVLLAFAYSAIALLQWLASYGQTYLARLAAYNAITELRNKVYRHVLHLDIGFHKTSKVGDISSVITNDIETLNDLISHGFVYFISDLGTVIAIGWGMYFLNRRLALLLLVAAPIVIASTRLIGRLLRRAQREVRKSIGRLTSGAEESIAGVREVKVFSQEERQARKMSQLSNEMRQANIRAAAISALLFPLMDLSAAFGLALIVWRGGLLLAQNALTLGVLMAAISYVRRIFGPLMDLSQIYTTYQNAGAALDRICTFLQKEAQVVYPGDTQNTLENYTLNLENMSFGYDAAADVLDQVNLSIKEGERIGIVGESGAGKSTLVALLARLYDPSSGEVKLGDVSLSQFSKAELCQLIQVIPQNTVLFPGTVWENIAYGVSGVDRTQVVELVSRLGLMQFFAGLDRGIDTPVGEGGESLSGGQRQAVAIARALLRDPRILILDEATSNLDSQTEQLLYSNILQLWRDRTLILVTHRTTSLDLVDKVFQIRNKRLVPVNKEELALAGWA